VRVNLKSGAGENVPRLEATCHIC